MEKRSRKPESRTPKEICGSLQFSVEWLHGMDLYLHCPRANGVMQIDAAFCVSRLVRSASGRMLVTALVPARGT